MENYESGAVEKPPSSMDCVHRPIYPLTKTYPSKHDQVEHWMLMQVRWSPSWGSVQCSRPGLWLLLLPDLCNRQLHQTGAVAVVALAQLQRGSRKWCGATEPRRTPLKLSETTLEAINIAEVVFGDGSAQIPFRISAQSAPACMVKVFPDACPKIRRPGLLLTPSNDDVQCFLLAKNHYQPLSNPSLLRSLLYPLDPLGSFRHDSIPTGSPSTPSSTPVGHRQRWCRSRPRRRHRSHVAPQWDWSRIDHGADMTWMESIHQPLPVRRHVCVASICIWSFTWVKFFCWYW